jgi:predicted nucleic acid-binding protein
MRKIYLDTCIVIYFVEKHPVFASEIETLFEGLDANDTLCCSSLVRLECLVMPLRMGDNILLGHYQSFFKAQEMLEIRVECFDDAARLRADFTSLKTPDAIHMATALHHDCDEFWTNDNRLDPITPSLVRNILEK